jgi:hypothetical protein
MLNLSLRCLRHPLAVHAALVCVSAVLTQAGP